MIKGSSMTEEQRKRISDGRKGKNLGKRPAEVGLKISASKKGVPVPEERRKRIAETLRGRKNPEHSKNLKEKYANGFIPWNKGKIFPGITRTCNNAKQWKKKVFERDGHKCLHCGTTEKLEVHHKIPWNENIELRFDVNNGMTLCKACHSKEGNVLVKHQCKGKIFQKGHIPSEETRRKISEANKGRPSWNKGLVRSEEHWLSRMCKECRNIKLREKRSSVGNLTVV